MDTSVYINKNKFDISLCKVIDTNTIYQDLGDNSGWCGFYRFYSNGCMNWFHFKNDDTLTQNLFNPNFGGSRGVYYKDGNKIIGDLFEQVDQYGHMGVLKEEFKVKGDTLIIIRDNSDYNQLYVKRKLGSGFLKYKADW